mmetsp:Transcript_105614/g.182114  ORF Transcript_105614/g.182114 Transcript_105614/m.182114 type:complete len:208 (-) Transcript_105614:278-901(-)
MARKTPKSRRYLHLLPLTKNRSVCSADGKEMHATPLGVQTRWPGSKADLVRHCREGPYLEPLKSTIEAITTSDHTASGQPTGNSAPPPVSCCRPALGAKLNWISSMVPRQDHSVDCSVAGGVGGAVSPEAMVVDGGPSTIEFRLPAIQARRSFGAPKQALLHPMSLWQGDDPQTLVRSGYQCPSLQAGTAVTASQASPAGKLAGPWP